MSDTPRTDAVAFPAIPGLPNSAQVVPAEFARTLERELRERTERCARTVEKIGHDLMHEHGSYDGSTNAWEVPRQYRDYIEALEMTPLMRFAPSQTSPTMSDATRRAAEDTAWE